jgi:hypothetical protein
VTEPFTAGGPGLVLPRDRDPPGRGRMYRRTRSISRSRISRTPSDRVPGCQGMTKLRERHPSLPAVTGYGCHAVTERLLLFTDELVSAPARLRACGWSVLYLRCSPWVSGCAGPGGHGGWPGPRVQRRRLPSAGTRRAVGGPPQPMTVCHQPGRRCPKTGLGPAVPTTIPTSSANSTGSSGATGNRVRTTDPAAGLARAGSGAKLILAPGLPRRRTDPGPGTSPAQLSPAYECSPVMNRLTPSRLNSRQQNPASWM